MKNENGAFYGKVAESGNAESTILYEDFISDPIGYIDFELPSTYTDTFSVLFRVIGVDDINSPSIYLDLYKVPEFEGPFSHGLYSIVGPDISYESVAFEVAEESYGSNGFDYREIHRDFSLFDIFGIPEGARDQWHYQG